MEAVSASRRRSRGRLRRGGACLTSAQPPTAPWTERSKVPPQRNDAALHPSRPAERRGGDELVLDRRRVNLSFGHSGARPAAPITGPCSCGSPKLSPPSVSPRGSPRCSAGATSRCPPLVLGANLTATVSVADALEVRMAAPRHVALRRDQCMLARRVQHPVAERTDVARGLQALRRAHRPPAGRHGFDCSLAR